MADQQRRARNTAIRSAVSLIGCAPYASLVLWGGKVLHGLRFTTSGPEVVLDGPSGPPVDPWPQPGVSPAHPVNAATAAESSAAVAPTGGIPAARGDRLLLLAPAAAVGGFGDEDVAARLNLCGPEVLTGRWVSVAFGGWVSPVADPAPRSAAVRFAERHPTPDLLGLGAGWLLLQMEIAEAVVRTERSCVLLDTEEATGLLVDDLDG